MERGEPRTELRATRVVLASRRHPERRSSIAIRPTHRDFCFQSKISIPPARPRVIFLACPRRPSESRCILVRHASRVSRLRDPIPPTGRWKWLPVSTGRPTRSVTTELSRLWVRGLFHVRFRSERQCWIHSKILIEVQMKNWSSNRDVCVSCIRIFPRRVSILTRRIRKDLDLPDIDLRRKGQFLETPTSVYLKFRSKTWILRFPAWKRKTRIKNYVSCMRVFQRWVSIVTRGIAKI